ncbi:MAG: sigma 54-interacting transcriptional regulator [Thermodesulfobacteriota bacterium]|nr:sigma 54-interacting transcriptional regulator [Thermodesulfobacteriota bacterium]
MTKKRDTGKKPFSSPSDIFHVISRIDREGIEITGNTIREWRKIVNFAAEIIGVSCAIIRRNDPPDLELVVSSDSIDNQFTPGDRGPADTYYCGQVIRSEKNSVISNARKEKKWQMNRDFKRGMVFYMGMPLFWPDGAIYGTISVLDTRAGKFPERFEKLLNMFKELVESSLHSLYQSAVNQRNLEHIFDNLSEGVMAHDNNRRIWFFNRAAEKTTGYRREEILGRDCHEIFNGPFCGGNCGFKEGVPSGSPFTRHYPLNILARNGESRRIEMTVNSTIDASGNPSGVIASWRDMTDLTRLRIQAGDITEFAGLIGRDPSMLQIYDQIRDLAVTDYPVQIYGETGTGKELVATAIHKESRRDGGPFVPVNCAALPDGILESELFGHVKGAFTGAVRDKKGRFDLARGGTLFLDEVAEMPMALQAKLLRVLEDGKFERVGGERTITADVRIVSATNRDLKEEVRKGRFRQDLYYRIKVVPIDLPPLKKRKSDIPLLVDHFFSRAEDEGHVSAGISAEAMAILTDYPWPGNVRELQNVIRFALVKCKGRVIQPNDLVMELKEWRIKRFSRGPSRKLTTEAVKAALVKSGGNKAKAARILGVGRATLYRFLAD